MVSRFILLTVINDWSLSWLDSDSSSPALIKTYLNRCRIFNHSRRSQSRVESVRPSLSHNSHILMSLYAITIQIMSESGADRIVKDFFMT